MHVAVDLNGFLQFVVTAFGLTFGLLYLIRNTASRYFVVDSTFDSSADYSSDSKKMAAGPGGGGAGDFESCAVCGKLTKKQCSGCKMVKYCSEACQRLHWSSEHKTKCKDLQSITNTNFMQSTSASRARKTSVVPLNGTKILKQSKKILFPYEEFVELFNWDNPGYPPCGLLNCGNSCFANVVLQCLAYTRPLVAYLLERGHRSECQRGDWCFMCEFQTHVERTGRSLHPFSPINILSRLPNIGGNLGYGKQEDAHEFMRFAIDTMQSVCLDEFGGEKAVHPSYQETTLIQHIFGGRLQSQVICTKCSNVSNQFENMMDLTVEIHGDAGSLEECLDQFTAKEWLHGDNMYKCDGCNDYVMAWKRLTVRRAPNVLTIALKRFQSGRFGKLNKRVTFPETLDLSPYMSEVADGNDVYRLYAVIVHVDMLNASYFGHYICYIKDFRGKWYRIDDCKVASADLDEVLSQGAYMLLYSRIRARPSCLLPAESFGKEEKENGKLHELDLSLTQPADCSCAEESLDSLVNSAQPSSANCSGLMVSNNHDELSMAIDTEDASGDIKFVSSEANLLVVTDVELQKSREVSIARNEVASPISDLKNGSWDSKSNSKEGLFRMSSEKSSVSNSSILENLNSQNDSCMAFTSGEVLVEVTSASSKTMPECGKCGNGSPSPHGTGEAANKSNGECSGVKSKPLFAPGFLDQHPRNKGVKQEDKVSVELSGHSKNQTNEFAKPTMLFQNGGFLKGAERPTLVHENGKGSMKSNVHRSLENGDCGDQSAYGEGTKSNTATDEKLHVGD